MIQPEAKLLMLFVIAVTVLTAGILLWRRTRTRSTQDGIVCGTCGYPIKGLKGPRCPECGEDPIDPGPDSHRTERSRLNAKLLMVCGASLLAGFAWLMYLAYWPDTPNRGISTPDRSSQDESAVGEPF